MVENSQTSVGIGAGLISAKPKKEQEPPQVEESYKDDDDEDFDEDFEESKEE